MKIAIEDSDGGSRIAAYADFCASMDPGVVAGGGGASLDSHILRCIVSPCVVHATPLYMFML